uniref:Uncharacterized protein n=1 Tax=Solanum lycopersicum TaxID=4081 RepID=A0A3Q7F8N1_SOLLC
MSIKSLYEWAVTLHFIRSWTRRICSEDLHLDIDRFANTVLKWRDAAFQLRTCNCCGTHAYSILAFIVVDVIGGGELTQRSRTSDMYHALGCGLANPVKFYLLFGRGESFRGVFDSGTWNLLNVEVLLWSSDVNAFAFVKVDVILYFQFDQPIEVYAFASVTVDVIFYQLDQEPYGTAYRNLMELLAEMMTCEEDIGSRSIQGVDEAFILDLVVFRNFEILEVISTSLRVVKGVQITVSELRAALEPLSSRSLKFSTDVCLRRFLEARYWKSKLCMVIANSDSNVYA